MLRNRISRRRKGTLGHPYQNLETRRLLAGDVRVFQNGDIAFIRGDQFDNEIYITANDAGEVVIRGEDGTTINRQEEVVLHSSNATIGSIRVHTGPGDDTLFVEGIQIEERAIVYGGTGDDDIGFFNVGVADDLVAQTWTGDDTVSLDQVSVGKRLVAFTFGGDDTVGIDTATIEGRTLIQTGEGSDDLAIDSSLHVDRVFVLTGSGDDFVSFNEVGTENFSAVITQDGHDEVVLEKTTFGGPVFASGGSGSDDLENRGDVSADGFTRVFSFEGDFVEDSVELRDEVFSDLIESGSRLGTIAEIAALTPDLSTLLGALQATGLDSAVAGPGPLTVFAPLNSAFEEISDVVATLSTEQLADVLTFHVAAEEIDAADLVTRTSVDTLLGQPFSVDVDHGVVLNGNVTLAATDIRAKNGIVHLLNEVLIPA